jgi:hypothetical protein
MDPESVEQQVERHRLIKEFEAGCQAFASERVDRYLRAQHHGIVADTPFAPASAECIDLFRDGHFYGAISLSQAVGEALVRHMCRSNQWKPAENFEENVRTLEHLALTKIRALGEIERFVFAWSPSETPGAIRLLRPQYWPDRKENRVGVFLRNPSV